MFNRLRLMFVAFTMAAVVIILAIIITLINVLNYKSVAVTADEVLDSLAQYGGRFPSDMPRPGGGLTVETPYETRYFSVLVTSELKAYPDTSMISKVDIEQAISYTQAVLNSGSTRGYVDEYRFYVTKLDSNYLFIFMDCGRLLTAADNFLSLSIIISVSCALVVAAVLVLLSKKIVAPIANSYLRQKEFITNASHELKTPLTIISANSEIIELEAGKSESTESIQRQVARMAAMIKNMSALAVLEESGAKRDVTKFDFSEAVRDTAGHILRTAESRGRKTHTEIDEGIEYTGDEDLIRQLTNILLDNALKYSVFEITVSLTENKNRIELVVKNDTAGIEKGNLDKCFGRFYRADSARASGTEGSGIGLSVAKEITGIHKGKITAFSPDGHEFIIKAVFWI